MRRIHKLLTMSGGGAAAVPWYLTGGLALTDWEAVYQPLGAASYAASLINLINPATHTCDAPSGAPGWDAAYGWDFDTTQHLRISDLLAQNNYSLVVRYSDLDTTANWALAGARSTSRFYIIGVANTNVAYGMGATLSVTPAPDAAGTLMVCGHQGYRNGVADGAVIGDWLGEITQPIYIGAYNNNGSVAQSSNVRIQAIGIAKRAFTQIEAGALHIAMMALPF